MATGFFGGIPGAGATMRTVVNIRLSDPTEADNWTKKKDVNDLEGDGFVGFIHNCVIENYLNHHENPEDLELYFCGPPLMNQAVQKMGEDFGLADENIRFDDFGG
jgi:Na+-transporting NADH:ubiquinone oxidoreductase subunit F